MRGENHPKRAAVAAQREVTMGTLSEAFAQDQLTLAELEERMTTAQSCGSVGELMALTEDLDLPLARVRVSDDTHSPPAPLARVAKADVALARVSSVRTAMAVLGATERRLSGPVEGDLRAVAVLGAVELDLSAAHFPAGITQLFVTATLGAIEVTVPEDIRVECQGTPILGAFEDTAGAPEDDCGAVLRIQGSAFLGAVEVRRGRRRLP